MVKISHRGLEPSGLFGENCISAYDYALKCGADMIETDVRYHNGRLIMVHSIRDIKENALELNDALEHLKNKCEIILDIKNPNNSIKHMIPWIVKAINKHNMNDQIIASSFNNWDLLHIKQRNHKIRTGMLYMSIWTALEEEVKRIKPYSLHPELDCAFMTNNIHLSKQGYKIFTWTAKSQEEVDEAMQYSFIDGIMVNDLNFFKEKE